MNQTHTDVQVSPSVQLTAVRRSPEVKAQRLVVAIRDVEEEASLASRILELAQPRGLSILLFGIAPDPMEEASLRRQLVTIAAFVEAEYSRMGLARSGAGRSQRVDIRIECGREWLAKLRSLLQPGDLLACHSEDRVGLLERPMSDILSSNLTMPIYTLSGLNSEHRQPRSYVAQAAAWLISLASIAGFFVMEARVVTAIQGWEQSALLLVALIGEAGLIWVVNSILG